MQNFLILLSALAAWLALVWDLLLWMSNYRGDEPVWLQLIPGSGFYIAARK